MKNPNGYGCVRKLSGNRRRPFAAIVTTGYSCGEDVHRIDFLRGKISDETFEQLEKEYSAFCEKDDSVHQKQKAIGYFETRKEALIALAEFNRNPYTIDSQRATFADIYNIIIKDIEKNNPSSLPQYKTAFNASEPLHKKKISEITAIQLQKIVDSVDTSKSRQGQFIALYHKMFDYAEMNNLINKNVSKYVKVTSKSETRKKQPFTAAEIEMMWKDKDWMIPETATRNRGQMMVDIILILIYTGLRISELLNLDAEHVHLAERYIDVHGTKTAAAVRTVPIHQDIVPLLEKRLCEDLPVFRTKTGTRLSYVMFQKHAFHDIMRHFNFEGHTIHDTRHTFISYAQQSGLNAVMLKKIVGHASNDVTEDVYTHAFIENLVKEIDKFKIE